MRTPLSLNLVLGLGDVAWDKKRNYCVGNNFAVLLTLRIVSHCIVQHSAVIENTKQLCFHAAYNISLLTQSMETLRVQPTVPFEKRLEDAN
jgi:hypothetical protein